MQRQVVAIGMPGEPQASAEAAEMATEKGIEVSGAGGEGVPDAGEGWDGEDAEGEAEVEAGREGGEVVASEVGEEGDGGHGEWDGG